MADQEKTDPGLTREQKILTELNRGEGIAAKAVGAGAAWLALHPHLALGLFIVWNLALLYVGYKVGRP